MQWYERIYYTFFFNFEISKAELFFWKHPNLFLNDPKVDKNKIHYIITYYKLKILRARRRSSR